jgi:hypothetical protein
MVVNCDNTRCCAPARFRLVPYGQKRHEAHSCNRHLARTVLALLFRFGGPILTYQNGE